VNSSAQFFGLEALNIKGMTKKPKAKQDEMTGKWLPNGRRAKAGLNKAILQACWGSTHRKLTYKAVRQNKLVGLVPAAYSSQECSRCGHTHPDNRHDQRFVCQRCGFEAHADFNAALVIKQRAIKRLREGVYDEVKSSKRTAFRRKNSKTTDGLSAHACGADARPCGG
jgi:putative transposase